jgi:NADPH:quinone reductase-like Zn-dependent oxidoreductase
MRAVLFRTHGGPEVLESADVPDPLPGPGEVLVRVKACSVNHVDIWVRQGVPAYKIQLPHISGCDVAGTIERLGPGIEGLQLGRRVFLSPGLSCFQCPMCLSGQDNMCQRFAIRGAKAAGGYAQLAVARALDVHPIPDGMGFDEAAAFPLVFLTAWHMLIGRAGLRPGETVLVHAAGSGIGHAAVQIARLTGARVLATVGSDAKVERARALGAEAVIQHRREPLEERVRQLTDGAGVDVVFEHVGPETFEASVRALAKGGRLVTCGATTGPSAPLDLRYLFSRQLTLLGSMMGTRAELLRITELLGRGQLTPIVDTVFPLAEARAAQERMLTRDVFGKLILQP